MTEFSGLKMNKLIQRMETSSGPTSFWTLGWKPVKMFLKTYKSGQEQKIELGAEAAGVGLGGVGWGQISQG